MPVCMALLKGIHCENSSNHALLLASFVTLFCVDKQQQRHKGVRAEDAIETRLFDQCKTFIFADKKQQQRQWRKECGRNGQA